MTIQSSHVITYSRNHVTFSPKHAPVPEQRHVPFVRELGEEEVEDDDGDERLDEAFGARPPDAAGARAAGESFVATDQTDRPAEEKALGDPFKNLPVLDAHLAVVPVRLVRDAERLDRDEPPAGDVVQGDEPGPLKNWSYQ